MPDGSPDLRVTLRYGCAPRSAFYIAHELMHSLIPFTLRPTRHDNLQVFPNTTPTHKDTFPEARARQVRAAGECTTCCSVTVRVLGESMGEPRAATAFCVFVRLFDSQCE